MRTMKSCAKSHYVLVKWEAHKQAHLAVNMRGIKEQNMSWGGSSGFIEIRFSVAGMYVGRSI